MADLPSHHRDPFDRLLVAQATVLGVPIITADPILARYDIEVLRPAEHAPSGVLADQQHRLHNGLMPAITVRNVPAEARDALAARAAASGRSLQEYLRSELIRLADRPDPDALLSQIRERKRHTGSRLPADRILEHRDAERR